MNPERSPESRPTAEKAGAASYDKRFKKIVAALAAGYALHFSEGTVSAAERHEKSEKPTSVLEYVQKEEPNLSEEERKDLQSDLEYLREHSGKTDEEYLLKVHTDKKTQRGRIPEHPRIEGFEKIGIDNRDLQQIWSDDYFPQGWIEGNVPSITNVPEIQSGDKKGQRATGRTRQVDNRIELDAAHLRREIRDPHDIVFAINESFTHESIHGKDWDNDVSLTLRQRIDFLADVGRAFDAPGAFHGFNNCADTIKDPDAHRQRTRRISESWAMLGELYFNSPTDDFKKLKPAEQALAKKWIQRDDVLFDPAKALAKKIVLLERIDKKKFESRRASR